MSSRQSTWSVSPSPLSFVAQRNMYPPSPATMLPLTISNLRRSNPSLQRPTPTLQKCAQALHHLHQRGSALLSHIICPWAPQAVHDCTLVSPIICERYSKWISPPNSWGKWVFVSFLCNPDQVFHGNKSVQPWFYTRKLYFYRQVAWCIKCI